MRPILPELSQHLVEIGDELFGESRGHFMKRPGDASSPGWNLRVAHQGHTRRPSTIRIFQGSYFVNHTYPKFHIFVHVSRV